MAEYLSMMKQITSKNMQLAGSTISQDDLIISYVLAGLDAEYILIVCDIEGKNSPTWHDVYSTLVIFETKLVHLNIVNTNGDFGDSSANYVYSRQTNNVKNKQQTLLSKIYLSKS